MWYHPLFDFFSSVIPVAPSSNYLQLVNCIKRRYKTSVHKRKGNNLCFHPKHCMFRYRQRPPSILPHRIPVDILTLLHSTQIYIVNSIMLMHDASGTSQKRRLTHLRLFPLASTIVKSLLPSVTYASSFAILGGRGTVILTPSLPKIHCTLCNAIAVAPINLNETFR